MSGRTQKNVRHTRRAAALRKGKEMSESEQKEVGYGTVAEERKGGVREQDEGCRICSRRAKEGNGQVKDIKVRE